jgi:hypothetical protein
MTMIAVVHRNTLLLHLIDHASFEWTRARTSLYAPCWIRVPRTARN